MDYVLYSDESGTSSSHKCYAIGAILTPVNKTKEFHDFLLEIKEKHKINHEIKWEYIRKSYNSMNFAIELLNKIITGPYVYNSIIVLKRTYGKWQTNKENAFYTTYSLLIGHCAEILQANITAEIDERDDSYNKHHEVIEKIVNYKLTSSGKQKTSVARGNSKETIEIQAADIITGAICAAHNLFINPELQINKGKQLLLMRLSSIVGWQHLHHDTMPNGNFNIWHFPPEGFRNVPKTMEINHNAVAPVELNDLKLNNII